MIFEHEIPECKVEPTEIKLPDVFPGRLIVGGLSHALHTTWLRFNKVTLGINCIGKYDKEGNIGWRWQLVEDAKKQHGIPWKHFPLNNVEEQELYFNVFEAMREALSNEKNTVYVHCKIT